MNTKLILISIFIISLCLLINFSSLIFIPLFSLFKFTYYLFTVIKQIPTHLKNINILSYFFSFTWFLVSFFIYSSIFIEKKLSINSLIVFDYLIPFSELGLVHIICSLIFSDSIKIFLLTNRSKYITSTIILITIDIISVYLMTQYQKKYHEHRNIIYLFEISIFLCIAIYYFIKYSYSINKNSNKKNNKYDNKTQSILNINEITSTSEDKLNFSQLTNFAYTYISSKLNNNILTLAINASWGSGKTSLANLIIEKLQNNLDIKNNAISSIKKWSVFKIESAHLQKYNNNLTLAFYNEMINNKDDNLKYLFENIALNYKPNILNTIKLFFRPTEKEIIEYINENNRIEKRGIIYVIDDIDRLNNNGIKDIISIISNQKKNHIKNSVIIACYSATKVAEILATKQDSIDEFYLNKYFDLNIPIISARQEDLVNLCLYWFSNEFFKNLDDITIDETNDPAKLFYSFYIQKFNLHYTDTDLVINNVKDFFSNLFNTIKLSSIRELKQLLIHFETFFGNQNNKNSKYHLELNFAFAFLLSAIKFYSESVYINLSEIISEALFNQNSTKQNSDNIKNNSNKKDNSKSNNLDDDFNPRTSIITLSSINEDIINKYTNNSVITKKIISIFTILNLCTFDLSKIKNLKDLPFIYLDRISLFIFDGKYINYLINIYTSYLYKGQNLALSLDNFINLATDSNYPNKLINNKEIVIFAIHLFLQNVDKINSLNVEDIYTYRKLISSFLYCPIFTSKNALLNYSHSINMLYQLWIEIFADKIEFLIFSSTETKKCLELVNDDFIAAIILRFAYIKSYSLIQYKQQGIETILILAKNLDILLKVSNKNILSVETICSALRIKPSFLRNNFLEIFVENSRYSLIKESFDYINVTFNNNKEYIVNCMSKELNNGSNLLSKDSFSLDNFNVFSIILIVILKYMKLSKRDIFIDTRFTIKVLCIIYLIEHNNTQPIDIKFSKLSHNQLLKTFFKNLLLKNEILESIHINNTTYKINKERLANFKYIYATIDD